MNEELEGTFAYFFGAVQENPWSSARQIAAEPPASEQMIHLLSHLQLEIGVEIGTLEMSAAELISLAAGATFKLGGDQPLKVKLRLGEEEIGSGLVRIGEDGAELEIQSVAVEQSTTGDATILER